MGKVIKMKDIMEYVRDVKWWIAHYDKGWWKNKNAWWNALYCVAPTRWKTYNRFLHSVFNVK